MKDRPRSGRRRTTTGREDRALVRLARQQSYVTSSTLRNHWPTNVRVSTRTVGNRLGQHGHISCHPARKPRLTARNRQRFNPDCIQPCVAFGGGSVMVWGMVSLTCKSDPLGVASYATAVCQTSDSQFAEENGSSYCGRWWPHTLLTVIVLSLLSFCLFFAIT